MLFGFSAKKKEMSSVHPAVVQDEEEEEEMTFLSAEEEQAILGMNLSAKVTARTPTKTNAMTIEDHMRDLEQTFKSGMDLTTAAPAAGLKNKDEMAADNLKHQDEDPLRTAYAELHSPADKDLVERLKIAMQDIPEGTKGLEACKSYFSQKQYYTMLDVLVAQYVLNDGLLMRQHHDQEDEYHVDISEPAAASPPVGLATHCEDDDEDSSESGSGSESD